MAEAQEVVIPTNFTSAVSLTEMGLSHVPKRFILPVSQRPNLDVKHSPNTSLPLVDLALLRHNTLRSHVIGEIGLACKEFGFFQVINCGIPPSLIEGAMEAASEFFNLPVDEKMLLMSGDVKKPVRYGTSLNHVKDTVYFWRDFLKHYSHPLSKWNCQGLQVMDKEGKWVQVPAIDGVLLVHVGDHLEVMSNGRYKSVVHRATVNAEKRRISIASLHSFAMEKKVRPVPQLVDDQHPLAYGDISFKDFLDFLSRHAITKKGFIETVRLI
ncbi:protein DMR6-LIKE OXYGENASE 1-like protein [Cinnamomum micranthum f. kanehirae]|uniref:Protein DMR6-LIKE OXYGENASE 1-like protein n=1 Tax=Cinnamomum micranthum f. kanehirae TaxID=337451 RepID=A0A443P9B2_9MAGN|nr:protein DMR6-LIKE OXYGENASE 1-like protein [Cinnamomum micranthum f. kanehirae]